MVIKKKRIKVLKRDLGDLINSNNIKNKNFYQDIIILNNNKKKNDRNILNEKPSKLKEIKDIIPIMNYTDDELNDLSYDSALDIDKRTFYQFYISLIKTRHEVIFAFFL